MENSQKHRIVNQLRRIDQNFKRIVERKVADTGVYRSQHRLLMMLGKFPECSQTELAEKMDISPAAVAVSLKKLEKAGYISRRSQQNDNRTNRIFITPRGKATIDVSIQYFREIEDAFFQNFGAEDMQRLEQLLERLIQNEEEYYEKVLEVH